MKSQFTFVLLAAVVIGLWRATAGFAASPRDLIDQMIPVEVVLTHASELGLSAEQRRALQESTAALQSSTGTLVKRTREESDALVELLQKEKPAEAAVLAQFDKLSAMETELKRLRLMSAVRVKSILTPEQQTRALALKSSRAATVSPGSPAAENLPAKLQRVKDGLERWNREGRDVTRLREQWERFREAESKGRFGEARKALDEALAMLDAPAGNQKPTQP